MTKITPCCVIYPLAGFLSSFLNAGGFVYTSYFQNGEIQNDAVIVNEFSLNFNSFRQLKIARRVAHLELMFGPASKIGSLSLKIICTKLGVLHVVCC